MSWSAMSSPSTSMNSMSSLEWLPQGMVEQFDELWPS